VNYSSREAAKFLAGLGTPFTAKTLETWRHYGKGPRYIKIAGRCFYKEDDLLAFAAGEPVETVHSLGLRVVGRG